MLQITMTIGSLYFSDLPDEIYLKLKEVYNLEEDVKHKGHVIKGSPQELYKILLKLSYTYDIELS